MATQFSKIEKTIDVVAELLRDYLAGKLSALYRIGKEKGMTRFGYLGDSARYEYGPDDIDENDEGAIEAYWDNKMKWEFVFAEINDEYVEMSRVVSGVTYVLEEDCIWVERFQESWEGDVLEDKWFRVYPHSLANIHPLISLMKLIAEELEVDLETI